ncbi:MAG: hypothetical protein JWN43_2261 [Gammaproteobacteria bacterium]|nr:hypothetical protein [Gammaproteobacteria bacterium]
MSLTEKGFSVLNEVPEAVAGKPEQKGKSLGVQMREAAVSKGLDLAAELVKAMFKPPEAPHWVKPWRRWFRKSPRRRPRERSSLPFGKKSPT